jgi:sugar phosphate isomerase/epimerase
MMKFSLSGFLFEDDYDTLSLPFSDFCELARSAGYDMVDLRATQISPATPSNARREMRRVLDGLGLEVSQLTARNLPESGQERDDYFSAYLELCGDMACPLIKIISDTDWLQKAVAQASDVGVTLATNNHTNSPLETVDGTREYFEAIDDERMALLFDPMHLDVGNQNYLRCIDEFVGRMVTVLTYSVRRIPHSFGASKPRLTQRGQPWYMAPPDVDGVQDWPTIIHRLIRNGYEGSVTVFENGWPTRMREQIAHDRIKFFKDLAGGKS